MRAPHVQANESNATNVRVKRPWFHGRLISLVSGHLRISLPLSNFQYLHVTTHIQHMTTWMPPHLYACFRSFWWASPNFQWGWSLFICMPRHEKRCCCCNTRVDNKLKYKTIGPDTIDKLQPHAYCTITPHITYACNNCYKTYTKQPASKVWPSFRPHVMLRIMYVTCLYTWCMHVRLGENLAMLWNPHPFMIYH